MKSLALGTVSILALGATAGHAADLYIPPAETPPPFFSWTGPYIGGNVGAAILDGSMSITTFAGTVNSGMDDTGITFGGQAGWNWQADRFVFGVEGDFNYLDLDDSFSNFNGKGTTTVRADYDWFATVRGRAGFLVDPQILIFGTGGVAFTESDLTVTTLGASASDSDVLVGFTVGGGIEYAWSQNISAKLEYLYANFEEHDLGVTGIFAATGSAEPEMHLIRAGINWHF